MKKLFVTAVIAGSMMFSVGSVNAQVYENSEGETPAQQTQQETRYTQIEEQDLPKEVRQAVQRDYRGSNLTEVYSAEQDGETTYKLVVITQDGLSEELYSDARGNWIEVEERDSE